MGTARKVVVAGIVGLGVWFAAAWAVAGGGGGFPDAAGASVLVRVEGPTSTVFQDTLALSGTVDVVADNSGNVYTLDAATPLGALELASRQAGFDVQVTDRWIFFDLFVDRVAGVGSVGFNGWLFRVEAVLPYYGSGYGWQAFGPSLQDGDEVLWYWGMAELPSRLTQGGPAVLDRPTGFLAEATDQDYFHVPGDPWPTAAWTPLAGATVHLDGQSSVTGGDGWAYVTPASPGPAEAFAEEPGTIRSARLAVDVALGASVAVEPGTIQRDAAGRWVTVWIELPAGYDPLRLDRATLTLGGVSVAEPSLRFGHVRNPPLGDGDGDGLPELMVKFDRSSLGTLSSGTYSLLLTGTYDGTYGVFGESEPVRLL